MDPYCNHGISGNSIGTELRKIEVYYIFEEQKWESKIFEWLHISPSQLQAEVWVTFNPDEDIKVTTVYIQWGKGRKFDDMKFVRSNLKKYSHVTDDSTIYILDMEMYDDAEKHIKECVGTKATTEGNITFLEIHHSHNGNIHNCKGNKFNVSQLEFVEHGKNQNQGQIKQASSDIGIWNIHLDMDGLRLLFRHLKYSNRSILVNKLRSELKKDKDNNKSTGNDPNNADTSKENLLMDTYNYLRMQLDSYGSKRCEVITENHSSVPIDNQKGRGDNGEITEMKKWMEAIMTEAKNKTNTCCCTVS